jgi:hypothetical protein
MVRRSITRGCGYSGYVFVKVDKQKWADRLLGRKRDRRILRTMGRYILLYLT